jgi:DNA polymerase III epsilon subunit-like protein
MDKKIPYLIIDTETTGLDPEKNAVIEIAAMPWTPSSTSPIIPSYFHTLVKPHTSAQITEQALKVNGHYWCQPTFDTLDEDQLKKRKAAKTPIDAIRNLNAYIKKVFPSSEYHKKIVLVGWNVSFDELFLKSMHKRCVYTNKTSLPWLFHYHKIDMLSVLRYVDMMKNIRRKSYSLENIAKDLGVDFVKEGLKAHNAVDDVFLVLKVIEYL